MTKYSYPFLLLCSKFCGILFVMKQIYNEYEYTKMPFGKHKGVFLRDLPLDYLKWLIKNISDEASAYMFAIELCRRDKSFRHLNKK